MIFDVYLDFRLKEWANYCIDIKLGNVGWPKESLISKAMLMGVLIRSTSTSKPPISHPRAEQVGYWIMRLSKIYPEYSEAIALSYLNPRIPSHVLAKQLNISKSIFNDRIRKGKVWLSGYLMAYSDDRENSEITSHRSNLIVNEDKFAEVAV